MPNAWASYSVNTAKHGDTRQQVGLNGTTLADNNLSYSLQQSYTNHGVGGSGNINADYKGGQGKSPVATTMTTTRSRLTTG